MRPRILHTWCLEASLPQHDLADLVSDVHGVVIRVPVPITQSITIGVCERQVHAPCNVVVFTDFPDGARVGICHRRCINIAGFNGRASKRTGRKEEGSGDSREARKLHCVVMRDREVVVKGDR